ncbi:MAG: 50S ribosomal protein P1 [DPANN group archaeon]|nr:50S ribosomal protein P1 [DPANN group archaeon]
MEYIYAAMLLHALGNKVDEPSVKKVLDAAGAKTDDSRVKALIAALDGVDMEEAINTAALAPQVAVAPVAAPVAAKEEKKEEPKPEAAAAGLGALFG